MNLKGSFQGVGTLRSGAALVERQTQRFKRVVKALEIAHAGTIEPIKAKARRFLSGHLSTKLLRLLGHPFGKGEGRSNAVAALRSGGRRRKVRVTRTRVPVPKLPINLQTGRLRSSLIVEVRRVAGATVNTLRFIAPYAKYVLSIEGTRKMVARGFWQALLRESRREYEKVLKAGSDAFKDGG